VNHLTARSDHIGHGLKRPVELMTAMPHSAAVHANLIPNCSGIGALALALCGCLAIAQSANSAEQGFAISQPGHHASSEYSLFDAAFDQTEGSLSSSFSTSNNSDLQQFTRLETAWAGTVPLTPIAMRMGDAVSDPGSWGNAVRFGGVKFGSLQELPADIVTSPDLSAGRSTLRSSADIVSQNIDRMTRLNSSGDVTLGVNDVLGRMREISKPLYTDIALTPKGKADYSFSAGRVREDFALADGEYGARFAAATLRYGLRRSVTVDAHAAQLDGVVSVMGAGLAKDAGARGKLSAAMATSRNELAHGAIADKPNGWLARAAYRIANDYFVVALRTRVQSATYRDLDIDEEPATALHRRTLASIALRLGPLGDLLLAGAMQTFHDATRADFVSVRHSMPVGSASKLSASFAYNTSEDAPATASIAFTHPFGANRATR
jgi:outer membrane usher protein